MRLTEAFRRKGHSIGYCRDINDLKSALKSLSNAGLHQIIDYQMQIEPRNRDRLRRFHDAGPDAPGWRDGIDALIEQGRMGKYFLVAHPRSLLGILHAPFLKKDRQPMYRRQRAELLAYASETDLSPVMRAAIEAWDHP